MPASAQRSSCPSSSNKAAFLHSSPCNSRSDQYHKPSNWSAHWLPSPLFPGLCLTRPCLLDGWCGRWLTAHRSARSARGSGLTAWALLSQGMMSQVSMVDGCEVYACVCAGISVVWYACSTAKLNSVLSTPQSIVYLSPRLLSQESFPPSIHPTATTT